MVQFVYCGERSKGHLSPFAAVNDGNNLLGSLDHVLFEFDFVLIGIGQAFFDGESTCAKE